MTLIYAGHDEPNLIDSQSRSPSHSPPDSLNSCSNLAPAMLPAMLPDITPMCPTGTYSAPPRSLLQSVRSFIADEGNDHAVKVEEEHDQVEPEFGE